MWYFNSENPISRCERCGTDAKLFKSGRYLGYKGVRLISEKSYSDLARTYATYKWWINTTGYFGIQQYCKEATIDYGACYNYIYNLCFTINIYLYWYVDAVEKIPLDMNILMYLQLFTAVLRPQLSCHATFNPPATQSKAGLEKFFFLIFNHNQWSLAKYTDIKWRLPHKLAWGIFWLHP